MTYTGFHGLYYIRPRIQQTGPCLATMNDHVESAINKKRLKCHPDVYKFAPSVR